MGEQLRANCSFLAPQAAEYEAIRVLGCQIFSCLIQFAGCLWLCECVCVCKCTYIVCACGMSSIPPPHYETMKALMHSEYLCLSNLGDRLLKVFQSK